MNDLINSMGGSPLTMSSIEIAELCEKRHDHVMRDIRVMLEALNEGLPKFGGTYSDRQGKAQNCFHLPRDLTMTLITGYSIPLRKKVIDRLDQLERHTVDPSQMLNDPAAMRGLLLNYTEKVIALESRIEADKPKTSFYDAYINADGLYTIQNAARALNCRPNLFARWLKQKYVFYQGTALVPRIQYIQNGVFEVKSEIVDDKARPRSFITAKGLEYFASRVPDEIKVARAA